MGPCAECGLQRKKVEGRREKIDVDPQHFLRSGFHFLSSTLYLLSSDFLYQLFRDLLSRKEHAAEYGAHAGSAENGVGAHAAGI